MFVIHLSLTKLKQKNLGHLYGFTKVQASIASIKGLYTYLNHKYIVFESLGFTIFSLHWPLDRFSL